MKTTIILLIILILALIYFLNDTLNENVKYAAQIIRLKQENLYLISMIENTNKSYYTKLSKTTQDNIDAVKLAMKISHPDNGGKKEDFIKYRKLYETLTR